MALNIQTLKTRSGTAVIFVAVMLVGLLWNFWSFLILFTVIHFGCWYEYVKLIKKIYGNNILYFLLGLIYITMPMIMLVDLSLHFNLLNVPYNFGGKPHFALPAWINLSTTTLYIVFPCLIIASIWINDTMAYIVGSLIGKTPFSKISPKKTWEGTIGGIVLCIVAMYFIGTILNSGGWIHSSKIISVAIIAALCAIFGTLGDLFESKLKRMANVKDSGSFMPGHGGFLDRFDSLLFAVPAVWVYVKLFL